MLDRPNHDSHVGPIIVWLSASYISTGHECSSRACARTQAPLAPRKTDNLSKEMKKRLRQEYMGLGGAENTVGVWHGCDNGCRQSRQQAVGHSLGNLFMACACAPVGAHSKIGAKAERLPATKLIPQAMSSNYFLWIIVVVSALAVASKLTGAL
jgi:hypothetical protein